MPDPMKAFITAGDVTINQYDLAYAIRDRAGVNVFMRNRTKPIRITGTAALDFWHRFTPVGPKQNYYDFTTRY